MNTKMPVNANERRLTLQGGIEAAEVVLRFVADCALTANLNTHAVEQLQIAVGEACTNIVTHGFGGQIDGELSLVCVWDRDKLIVTLIDSSPPFNPLDTSHSETRADTHYGLQLLNALVDETQYRYEAGRNRLTLVKYLGAVLGALPASITPKYSVNDIGVHAQRVDDVWVVGVTGALNAERTIPLETALQSGLEQRLPIIVDFSAVTGLTTAAIKILVKAWQRARDDKHDLILASVSAPAREILAITGLDLVFMLANDVESAMRFLTPKTRRASKRPR